MQVNKKFAMIFKNEKDGKTWYSFTDSSKNLDGTYTNRIWNIRFKKGTEPKHKSKINFDGFTSYYSPDDSDKVYDNIQVMNWTDAEQVESNQTQYVPSEVSDNMDSKQETSEDPFFASSNIEVDDDDLPFYGGRKMKK